MARDLTAAVGPGCPNLPHDIRTIQELLVFVPPHEGGTSPPLPADGVASPAFIAALKAFIERNPSLLPEAGRVNPGGPTMARLNDYDPLRPLKLTSRLMCPHGGTVSVTSTGRRDSLPHLTLAAQAVVTGCPMQMPQGCTTARWVASPNPNFLDQRSSGICTSAQGGATGPVMVLSP